MQKTQIFKSDNIYQKEIFVNEIKLKILTVWRGEQVSTNYISLVEKLMYFLYNYNIAALLNCTVDMFQNC